MKIIRPLPRFYKEASWLGTINSVQSPPRVMLSRTELDSATQEKKLRCLILWEVTGIRRTNLTGSLTPMGDRLPLVAL
jgi:hypothetical protein